jgi:tetratricopeptide (TPR) repeat protein
MRWLPIFAVFFSGALHAQSALAMPFFNHSGDASIDWIGESVAGTVHDALASEGLLALDRDSRMEAYRRLSLRPGAELTHASILKVAEALDAAQVIYGFYEVLPAPEPAGASKGSLRISARIVDMKAGTQGAAFEETGAMEDLATVEERLGWQTLESLSPKSAPPEDEFLKARPPVRLDALESYTRGLLATAPDERRHFFSQAARLDDRYSQPCFQLGKASWEQKDYKVAADWLARVSRSDPHYLEARFFFGLCRYYTGNYQAAEDAFKEVEAAVPLNEVYNDLGAAEQQRDASAAIESYRKALEGDDADPDYRFNLGYAEWRMGRFDEAVESFRAALDRQPNDAEAVTFLGMALKREGPRPGDPKTAGRQRLKTNYDEEAYRELKAELKK